MESESSLYVLQNDREMVRLEPTSFANEGEFQQLLERFPELIPGDQIDRQRPRRWLLIGREVSVPDSNETSGRWALDHLFVDQDGIPTLVEVKRHTDSRIRREVVGQMMDYAANAVTYWPSGLIRDTFAATCQKSQIDPDEAFVRFLGDEQDPADFWATVQGNLRDGNVRLIFVADRIPSELQRIVEFLNERMSPTEVLAVEVQQYRGGGLTTHIPRLYGQTVEAQMGKRGELSHSRQKWDEQSFFQDAERLLPRETVEKLRTIYDFFRSRFQIDWGTGSVRGSFNPKSAEIGRIAPLTVYSDGEIFFKFSWMDTEAADAFRKTLHQNLVDLNVPMSDVHTADTILTADEWADHVDGILEASEAALATMRNLSNTENLTNES